MHSIKSIAALIAGKDGLGEEAAALVHSQARNLAARGYITPLPAKRGRTSAGSFDDTEVARARILVELVDSGYRLRDLTTVNAELNAEYRAPPPYPESMRVDGGFAYLPNTLQQAMHGVSVGEDWRLRIERWKKPSGEFFSIAKVAWAGSMISGSLGRIRQIFGPADNVLRKVDELRLTPLLAGFIDA